MEDIDNPVTDGESAASVIAARLRDIATALELAHESRFRVQAYERGAEAVEAFSGDLDRWIDEGRLHELPGIGEKLAALITEIRATGTAKLLNRLSADLPPGALELARGPRLSLRAIRTLSEAGIQDLDALHAAAEGGRLRTLRGFSEKTEKRIVAEMAAAHDRCGELILRDATTLAADVVRYLARPGVEVDVVGEVRRGLEVVGTVSLLTSGVDPIGTLTSFERYPRALAIEHGPDGCRIARLLDGARVDLHAVLPSARAAALQRLTGSDAHNRDFDAAALRAGIVVESGGAFEVRGGERTPLSLSSEEELYARARIAWVPPEVREGEGEVGSTTDAAPPRLIDVSDIRGMVHCHSDYSDGRHTIREMAQAAQDLGMRFITITDHSPTAHYARGLDIDRLYRQWDEIARVQESLSIRILRGTESDILKDGALDYPDPVLERMDVIVASIHNRYRLDRAAMTARVIRAIRHPLFKIWGHALGRILLHRPPIECDVEAILDAAMESQVAIELNGNPHRLDMAPSWAKRARDRALRFVVSVDAHSTRDFANVSTGVTMARRAGLTPAHVLNALDADDFIDAVSPTGSRRSTGARRA